MLAPFGLAVGLASPAWYWVLRPNAGRHVASWLPGGARGRSLAGIGSRVLPIVGALFLASVAVTAVIALPVVPLGEPVSAGPLTASVTDARTGTAVTELGGETVAAEDGRRLLLVHLAVENGGDARRPLPGRSVGDVAVIAPVCSANNFGEPANNCNRVHLDGDFSAGGETYANYDARRASSGGTIGPGHLVAGWLVYRLETAPRRGSAVRATVVVDDVGRWAVGDGSWDNGASP